MMKESALSLIRHILTAVGAYVATTGRITETDVEFYVGALVTLVATMWGIVDKLRADRAAMIIASTMLPLALLGPGCAIIQPGNDPVVVNAERTTQLAVEVFDGFLAWEYDNRQALSSVPQIKVAADFIRMNAQAWLVSARSATKAYKANRTEENKADVETAIAVLRSAIVEARKYMGAGEPQKVIITPPMPG